MRYLLVLLLAVGCSKKVIKEEVIIEKPVIKEKIVRDTVEVERTVIKEVETPVEIYNPENILFEFDSYQLDHASIQELAEVAEYMQSNPNIHLVIGGHACPIGTYEYNLTLSQARADKAKEYLITLGIDPDRIETVSYGEERLINDNPSMYWVNRRDNFTLVTK